MTYNELADAFVKRADAALQDYKSHTTKDSGNSAVAVFAETGQRNRFFIFETWTNASAQKAHAQGPGDAPKPEWWKTGALAPADVRLYKNYNVADAKAPGRSAVYVVAHVDVGPPGLPALEALLKPLAETSRKEAGNLRFDILQAANRAKPSPLMA